MVMMSDLPHDLVDDALSRVPLTSLKAVRRTCKTWNNLSNGRSFIKKHIGKAKAAKKEEFHGIMVMNFRVYLMSFNLHGTDPSVKREGTLVSQLSDANHHVDISRVYHCDGLLLCITNDINSTSLVVWNPYLGQTVWIKPRISYDIYDNYAMGYESGKSNSLLSHKILRCGSRDQFELYSFKSNSWKVLDVTPHRDRYIDFKHSGISLKGNTYWCTNEMLQIDNFLICFDFTKERFGPFLPLPFLSGTPVILSNAGEEKIAVLCRNRRTSSVEIWITSKIEPKEVSWNKLFLKVDMYHSRPLQHMAGFFIDRKNNAAVVVDNELIGGTTGKSGNIAYIIGKNGYFKQVDLGVSTGLPLMCSYVPSSKQIKHVTY